ncbi:TetR/AcrR family transcriptional regulator [Alkalihalophilus marmarensis]|jgi:AcrR family transcriptional regulator|uniref:HTH tetR-type domain-containing protein n=1 Tax=Alkalihalophilus marmarensis DSM 21297 TaxID=1188261 RepID=U6SJR1_9BACI|nr:TetR/AcrR family transcriptional regulator [Alkalihalophilus marmarensis]ERN51180.1 hypothetical protein A33I_20790 [Alkalihalophilus marmarensis DSM 21297]MCM3488477.1 TetR/AcrR family transcriptional regulator [Alkalihalophilus marmarensis]
MNRRQLKGQETKKRILNTALNLFAKKGFHNVTVDEIVQQSSSSKGAFYNHFKSKHEIFHSKFEEIDQFYVSFVESQQIPVENSIYQQLLDFFEFQMTYIQKELGHDLIRTIYENELTPERESFFGNPDRPFYQILNTYFMEGQQRGEFRTDIEAPYMTRCIARAIRGLLYDWAIFNHSVDIVEESQKYLRYCLDGFSSKLDRTI